MKRILLLSAAVMAMLAGPAMAQRGDDQGRGGGGERGGGRPPAAAQAPRPAPAPQAGRAAPNQQRDQAHRPQPQNNQGAIGNNNRPGNNSNRSGAFNNNNRPGGSNNNRGGARPNYSQYHRAFNAPQRYRYRGPAYHRPPGFSYRRWNFGDFLPSLYFGSSYWINDFGYYNLMPPPAGTVWVRYGDDAVLIDRYTGEVIQVEYSVFY